jgi:acyl dehydratase
MQNFKNLTELLAVASEQDMYSDWELITQQQINLFADATGDHQWIHVDPDRAQKGPFGSPIAHGFLTLSLLPKMFASTYAVQSVRMGVNYGLNKVRFTSPVPVNSRVRAKMRLAASEPIDNNGRQLVWSVTMEREGSDKPVCVAESLTRLYE